jgi:hypothetical protein
MCIVSTDNEIEEKFYIKAAWFDYTSTGTICSECYFPEQALKLEEDEETKVPVTLASV